MEASRLKVKGCKYRPILGLWMSGNCGVWGRRTLYRGTGPVAVFAFNFQRINFYSKQGVRRTYPNSSPPIPWILVWKLLWRYLDDAIIYNIAMLKACVGKRWIMGGERDSKYMQVYWNLSALQTETNCYFKTFHLAADCRKRFSLCMQEQSLQIATWCRVAIWYMYIKYVFSFYNAQCDELMTTKLHLIYFKHVYQELHL